MDHKIDEIRIATWDYFKQLNAKECVIIQDSYPPLNKHAFYLYPRHVFHTMGFTVAVWKIKLKNTL